MASDLGLHCLSLVSRLKCVIYCYIPNWTFEVIIAATAVEYCKLYVAGCTCQSCIMCLHYKIESKKNDLWEQWTHTKEWSKGWIALKWQILWETNKFQVSFCSPLKFVRRFFVEKKKRATANNKGAEQPARMRRLICAFVVRTYIKAGSLSDSCHRSCTGCTTFVWTALQWRTNIHTLKHWVYFCSRMNTKLNSSQSHFL